MTLCCSMYALRTGLDCTAVVHKSSSSEKEEKRKKNDDNRTATNTQHPGSREGGPSGLGGDAEGVDSEEGGGGKSWWENHCSPG